MTQQRGFTDAVVAVEIGLEKNESGCPNGDILLVADIKCFVNKGEK